MSATADTVLAPGPPRGFEDREDHRLVAAVRRGDDRAFEALYARYRGRIAAYVYGMVGDHGRAEDIAQDVFISALRRMRQTERPIAFKPWIYEIAKNASIDQFRRARRAEEVSLQADEGLGAADYGRLVTSAPPPDVAVAHKQELDHLCGAFDGLSPSHHEILVLRELEGLSYREIGERMGLSRPSVESTLFRARRRLTEEYSDLTTGARCVRTEGLIVAAAEGALGPREHRRMLRHLAWCPRCRRHAHALGISARGSLGAKIAALLPIPAFLRGHRPAVAIGHGNTAALIGRCPPGVVGNLAALAPDWPRAVAALATLAVAGAGATVVASQTMGAPSRGHARRSSAHSATRSPRRAAPRRTQRARYRNARRPRRSRSRRRVIGRAPPRAPRAMSDGAAARRRARTRSSRRVAPRARTVRCAGCSIVSAARAAAVTAPRARGVSPRIGRRLRPAGTPTSRSWAPPSSTQRRSCFPERRRAPTAGR